MFAYELQRRLPALDLVISHKSLVLAVDGRQLLFHLNGIEAIRDSEIFSPVGSSQNTCHG